MKWVGLLASAAFAALLPLAAHAAEPTVIASPAAVKWHPAAAASGLPKGAEAAVLLGNPKEFGPFVLRVEFPSGAKVMPHTHNADHYITVISGVAHVGFGDKFDPDKESSCRRVASFTSRRVCRIMSGLRLQPYYKTTISDPSRLIM